MSLICYKNKCQALIKQVQFHITENVRWLDFDSVAKIVCSHNIAHLSFGEWRYGKNRSLRKFTVRRHALTLQIAHLLTSRKEKGTAVHLNALSRIRLENLEKRIRPGERCLNSIFHTPPLCKHTP